MSSGVADFGATLWLSQLLGLAVIPTGYWVALCTDQPGEGMDGDILTDLEPDPAAGYVRQWYSLGPDYWALNGRYGVNLLPVDYGVPSSAWGQLSHYAVLDAETSGNLVGFGEFLTPDYFDATTAVLIPPGGLQIAMFGLENSITP